MPLSETWVDFLAGWASGAVAVWTCQPVDTVLTRLQAGTSLSSSSSGLVLHQQGKALVQTFGWSSLWRGSSAMISAVPLQNAMLMGGYGIGKQFASDKNHQQSQVLWSVFCGGCTGGILQSFLMSPIELIKVNQQVHATKTAAVATREFLKSPSFWRGLNATLLRDGIPHGVWFASYEWCKTELTFRVKSEDGTSDVAERIMVPMASGAFAATVAWAVGYPFDIIKTRIQASSTTTTTTPTQQQHTAGIAATAMELMRESSGIRGLYRGFGLKLVRAVPASMVGFLTYETVAGTIRASGSNTIATKRE